MTAFETCTCSHTQRRHFENGGVCLVGECDCVEFEPTGAVLTPQTPAAAPRPAAVPPVIVRESPSTGPGAVGAPAAGVTLTLAPNLTIGPAVVATPAPPAPGPTACRMCGCTDEDCSGCVERTGAPCCWVEPDLCSACVGLATTQDRLAPRIEELLGAHPSSTFVLAIPCSQLFVDPTYQRPRDPRRVERMVAEFDVTQLGVLEVSDRGNGSYAIVEGQHRWHAARVALASGSTPDPSLVCKVHRGLTPAQEAGLFFEIDRGRKPLNFWDRYKARRTAGEALVVAIEQTASSHGYRIDPAPNDSCIAATSALERIVGLGGVGLLDATLRVIRAAYGPARDGVTAHILQAVALVWHNYDHGPELNRDLLVEALQDIAPRQLLARAVALREAHRAEMPRLVAAVIVDRYNARPGRPLQPLLQRMPSTSRLFGPAGRKTAELARIRRWAARNNLPHDVGGRIPQTTLDGYREALAAGITPR